MVHRGPPADVGAVGVQLDHGLSRRIELLVREVRPDHEQHVTAVEGDRAGVVAEQPGLADLVGVVVLEPLLALERDHHRRGQPLGQLEHLGPRVAGSLADEQRHPTGVVHGRGRAGEGLVARCRRRPVGDEPRDRGALGQVEAADVAGQGQHRDAPLVEGGVAGLLDEARQLVRRGDGRGEDGDVGEERVVVDLLEEVRADLPARHLAADGEHRGVGLLRVVQAVEQVDGAGADGAHADGEPVGELGLRAGRERPRLLVPHPDPLDALLAADRVGDGVERVAHHSPHLGHAVVGEGVDQQLGNGGHATPVRG